MTSSTGDNVHLTDGDRETIYQILMLLRNLLHLESVEFAKPRDPCAAARPDHENKMTSGLRPDFIALVDQTPVAVVPVSPKTGAQKKGVELAVAASALCVKPQNILLSNLFAQNFDKALLELLEHPDLVSYTKT
jgi:hypothetical protein